MSITQSKQNANAILSCLNNIKNDIQYLGNLKDIMVEAENKGVNVGDVNKNLENQVNELNGKIQKIGNDIHHSLNKLVNVEETIKKDDTKLEFDDNMSNADKFQLVYDRLVSDKQSLSDIENKVNEWNSNNALSIDGSSVQSLKNNIDDALFVFNDEVEEVAKEAQNYSQIVLEEDPVQT